MYVEVGNSDDSSLYADVREAGGLGLAIQAQLVAIGSPLRVTKADQDSPVKFPFDWEVVRQERRFSQIKTAKNERLFMLDFWDRGVCLAHGSTPLLPNVAEVIHAWIAEGVSTGELKRRFPFVGVSSNAKEHEEGAATEVETKWQSLYERVRTEEHKRELLPVVEAAMAVPVLRRLFPFTSLDWLCFSRCTGYPFSSDCPAVCPSRRVVLLGVRLPPDIKPADLSHPYVVADEKSNYLGQGDATEAIALVVKHLPPNCGPAVQGTAADLKGTRQL